MFNMNLPDEAITRYLGKYTRVLNNPMYRRDAYGFWNGHRVYEALLKESDAGFQGHLHPASERDVSEGEVRSGKQEALVKDIVREEVFSLQNGKTPGRDGIPKDLYAAFWEIMGEDLVDILNEAGKRGKMPSSMREGIIHLLFKKGIGTGIP
ncbi:hypothetical protein SKAU_G00289590 [Synaphobranchus kaupii]|uniref:Zinc finger CCHC domain-containing protein n=1 Tax=Synaphobranchus kaupii TaxID=118154 RepID=A0A9Q1ETG0_SYNKA|nr:hypothetical protein SKAU_G00289590 [Synaphobranchus kaupii]